MKYIVRRTVQFKKDYKLALKRNRDMDQLDAAIVLLASNGFLPPEYNDHPLIGSKKD